MKTASYCAVFLVLLGVAAAVNLRTTATAESEICRQARDHISFLENRIKSCSSSQQCRILKSALALLQGGSGDDTDSDAIATAEAQEAGVKEAIAENRRQNEELHKQTKDLEAAATAKSEDNPAIDIHAKAGRETHLGGTAADKQAVYREDNMKNVINKAAVQDRMGAIGKINLHMENVQKIMREYKEEHVSKCTDANNRLARHLLNEKENTEAVAKKATQLTAIFNKKNNLARREEASAKAALIRKGEYEDNVTLVNNALCQVARDGHAYNVMAAWRKKEVATLMKKYETYMKKLQEDIAKFEKEFGSEKLCAAAMMAHLASSDESLKEGPLDDEKEKVYGAICRQLVSQYNDIKRKHPGNKPWEEVFRNDFKNENVQKFLNDVNWEPAWKKASREEYIAEWIQARDATARDTSKYKEFDIKSCDIPARTRDSSTNDEDAATNDEETTNDEDAATHDEEASSEAESEGEDNGDSTPSV